MANLASVWGTPELYYTCNACMLAGEEQYWSILINLIPPYENTQWPSFILKSLVYAGPVNSNNFTVRMGHSRLICFEKKKKPLLTGSSFFQWLYLSTYIPGIGYTNHMINIREYDLQELVGYDGASIGETKQGVISEDCLDSHGSSVENTFMAQCTEGLQ